MIFRTITDEATGATTSIRLFGKSFSEFKGIFNSVKTNGFFKANLLSETDVQCIKTYNDAIKANIPHQQAMEQATKGASDSTAKMIKNANGNTIALNQMTLGAKAASVAMNVLSTVGNMLLITAITKGVEWLVTYNQRLEETRQEMIETGKEAAQLTEDLSGLVEQYRKLGEDGAFDNSDREQAFNIQQQINELLGDEVEYINLQNGEYEEQLELLKRLQYEKANDKYATMVDAKDAAEESLKKITGTPGSAINSNVVDSGFRTNGENEAVKKILKKENMEKYSDSLGGFVIDTSNTEAIIESYSDMLKLRNNLQKSYSDEIKQGGVLEDFYNNLVKKIDSMSDAVQKYKDAMSDYNINEAIVQFNETAFDGIKGAFIDSEDAMTTWMNKMISSKKVTDGVQIELIALAKTWYPQYIEQINNAINAEATKIIQDSLVDKSLSGNIESLKVEATTLGLTESAMISLVLAEINFNKNNLNVSQKVSALKELATWAGVAQAKMNSIFTANSKSTMKDKTTWANANNVTINKYADKDGTHTYTYNGKTYSGVNAVNEALLNEAIQSQIDKMNNIKVSPATVTSSGGGGGSSSSSSTKDVKETFDWIETAISRLQYVISSFGKTVSATWKSWTDRNSALKSQISAVTQEINKQQQAYNTYMSLANSVGLDPYYQALVQSGAMNISVIADENLAEQIKNYQDFFEKALSAQDAVIDLQDELKQLEQTDFDNIITQYEDQLSFIEHEISMLESTADILENKGYVASASIYDKLIQQESAKITSLETQYKALMDDLASNSIKQGTEQWNDMKLEILEVKEAILESRNALVEYNNTLRELDWEVFDKLQEKIEGIISESEFLIELMSDEKMFDAGKITEHGQATLGLYALNYKTYLKASEEYAQELERINAELADDPYNQTLLERRNELLEAQRDSILAAEDEKQSIKDLMNEGYDNLLSTMDELINKRKDMLSLIKDQYDYEKSIAEQTKEITTLEKQLSAYQGDDSEESRATIQKIKVSLDEAKQNLEETEYDKYISDQEQLLDTLYSDTEEWINNRIDNSDALLSEVISSTNANADTIRETLESETNDVGIKLSEQMENIWNTDGTLTSVISDYGNGITSQFTTLNDTLTQIRDYIAGMVANSNSSLNIGDISSYKAGWEQNSNGQYSYYQNGQKLTNQWFKDAKDNQWYHLDSEGTMDANKWIHNDSGTWSYVNGSGAAVTGWQQLDWQGKKDWYAFDEEGNMKANQWIDDYFVGSGGQMLTHTWVGHNGKYYYVGDDGKWLNLPGWSLDYRPNDGYPIYEYAKGSRRIPYDQVAWTQDGGNELIRTSDGALLTRLGKGDTVFTNEMTQRLWEMAQGNMILPNIKLPSMPNIQSRYGGDTQVVFEGDIQMYGVNDPVEFENQLLHHMKNSRSVRMVMKDTTIGEALGKNSMIRYTR